MDLPWSTSYENTLITFPALSGLAATVIPGPLLGNPTLDRVHAERFLIAGGFQAGSSLVEASGFKDCWGEGGPLCD